VGFRARFLQGPRRGAVAVATLAAALAAPAVGVRPAALAAQAVQGLSFSISSSTRVSIGETVGRADDQIIRGRGVATGKHARIELLVLSPLPDNMTLDDYLLALDSGRVVVVRPASENYMEASEMFGGPGVSALGRLAAGGRGFGGGGRGGRGGFAGARGGGGGGGGARGGRGRGGARGGARGFLEQVNVRDVKFEIEKLGAGDPIDGRPSRHYKITADYRMVWGNQGSDAHAVTEIWSVDLPVQIPNPFEPLTTVETVSDSPLFEYALKLARFRSQVEGAPVKVVTTTTLTGVEQLAGLPGFGVGGDGATGPTTLQIVQQTTISSIKPADVDPSQLMIPQGFKGP
jgi:hypothetical protein